MPILKIKKAEFASFSPSYYVCNSKLLTIGSTKGKEIHKQLSGQISLFSSFNPGQSRIITPIIPDKGSHFVQIIDQSNEIQHTDFTLALEPFSKTCSQNLTKHSNNSAKHFPSNAMLTPFFYQKFAQAVKLSRYLGLPYVWSSSTKTISVSHYFYANTATLHFCLTFELIFLFGQAVRFKLAGDAATVNFMIPLLYGTSCILINSSIIAIRPSSTANYYNVLTRYFEAFQERWILPREVVKLERQFNAVWTLFYWTTYLTMFTVPPALCMHIMYAPTNPMHFTSLFPEDGAIFKLMIIPYTIGALYFGAYVISFVQVLVLHGCAEMLLVGRIFSALKFSRLGESANRVMPEVRKITNLPLVYRSMQIVLRHVSEIHGPYILPLQFVIGKFTVVSTILISKMRKTMAGGLNFGELEFDSIAFLGLGIPFVAVGWSLYLIAAAGSHRGSVACLASWRHCRWETAYEKRWFKRFRKSCRPLFVGCEGYFKMEVRKLSVVNFIKTMLTGISRSLLGTKS